MEIFNAKEIYENYSYPEEFIKIVDLNLVDLDLWYLMNKEQVEIRIKGLKDRYPQRKLIPFARRDDGDDIACFEVEKKIECKLFMILLVLVMNKEKNMNAFGIGSGMLLKK